MKILNELIERYPALLCVKDEIAKAYEIIKTTYENGGKVLICGNGGSASDSEHIVGELMKSFVLKRALPEKFVENLKATDENPEDLLTGLQGALPAISLVSHTSLMTAFMNDCDPSLVFAQQTLGYGKEGDTLIALSTSGNSKNVLAAARVAKALNMKVVEISGLGGGKIAKVSDAVIALPEKETYKIQELTLPVYHALCLMIEEYFFG